MELVVFFWRRFMHYIYPRTQGVAVWIFYILIFLFLFRSSEDLTWSTHLPDLSHVLEHFLFKSWQRGGGGWCQELRVERVSLRWEVISQSEASVGVTWLPSANQRPVLETSDQWEAGTECHWMAGLPNNNSHVMFSVCVLFLSPPIPGPGHKTLSIGRIQWPGHWGKAGIS